jgi:hypothetical protein
MAKGKWDASPAGIAWKKEYMRKYQPKYRAFCKKFDAEMAQRSKKE